MGKLRLWLAYPLMLQSRAGFKPVEASPQAKLLLHEEVIAVAKDPTNSLGKGRQAISFQLLPTPICPTGKIKLLCLTGLLQILLQLKHHLRVKCNYGLQGSTCWMMLVTSLRRVT